MKMIWVLARIAAGFVGAWLAGWLFLEIGEELFDPVVRLVDRLLLLAIVLDRNPVLTQWMRATTWLGSFLVAVIVTLVAVAILLRRRRRTEAVALVLTLAGAGLLTVLLKGTYQRPRPDIGSLVLEPSYSFPSGHTITAIALYGFIAYLISRSVEGPGLRVIIWMVYAVVAMAVGYSRAYLGVHWPLDIVAGALAGLVWLITMVFALHLVEHGIRRRTNRRAAS